MNLKRNFTGRGLVLLLVLAMLLSMSAANLTNAQGITNSERIKVFIGFTETPGPAEEALVRAFGGTISHTYNIIPSIAAELPQSALAGLQKNPRVTIIEPVIQAYLVENYQEELDNTWGVKHIKAGAVHGEGQFGSEVKVAIIDTGIDYNHPDLEENYVDGRDFADDNDDPIDVNGHGTHVAGTVAALRDGKGVVGVAPEAKLYALKVFGDDGSASYADIVAAIEWSVDNNIEITNNSYGSTGDPGSQVKAAFDNSYNNGVLHVAAAGNSGNPPGRGDNVIYPARYSSVIAVAASDSNDRRASFSSTGPDVELTAPGVNINSTVPDDKYARKNGTSMASPHVAGTAALVMAAGTTGNDEVRQILRDTAEHLGNPNHFGYGLVNAYEAFKGVEPPEEDNEVIVEVSTLGADQITDSSALLEGELKTLKNANEATVYFEWRKKDESNWSKTDEIVLDSVGNFKQGLTDLDSNTEYEFRGVAEAGDKSDTGDTLSFTTKSIEDPGNGDNGEAAPLAIDKFELTDTSNPAWARVTVEWTVSHDSGNLSSVTTEMKVSGEERVLDSRTSSVSGSDASGTHELRNRHGHGETYEITLTVTDSEGNSVSESKSIAL